MRNLGLKNLKISAWKEFRIQFCVSGWNKGNHDCTTVRKTAIYIHSGKVYNYHFEPGCRTYFL